MKYRKRLFRFNVLIIFLGINVFFGHVPTWCSHDDAVYLDVDVARALGLPLKTSVYEVLQVNRNLSYVEIQQHVQRNWRRLNRQWHPDKNPDNKDFADRVTRVINNARDQLTQDQRNNFMWFFDWFHCFNRPND